MSSNMYGFTCTIPWRDRSCFVQVVFVGTSEDEPDSYNEVACEWGTTDPVELAVYELQHRDWNNKFDYKRISVAECYASYLDTDPSNVDWSPPRPTEREIMELIAAGQAEDVDHGWDT